MSRILPILFNTDMVCATLEGRKTVTRRVITPQPIMNICYRAMGCGAGKWSYPSKDIWQYWGEMYKRPDTFSEKDEKMIWNPPYHTDDILYVRETWHKYTKRVGKGESCRLQEFYGYKASIANSEDAHEKWHPSIHMPKEAARIWLKVTDVRVERLQEMTASESAKEGIRLPKEYDTKERAYILGFADLWDSTLKKSDLDTYGWDANPWVWVIEFERCDKPESEE